MQEGQHQGEVHLSKRERVLGFIGERMKVSGQGLEAVQPDVPLILAPSHCTDFDVHYAIISLQARLGGISHVALTFSSLHKTDTYPLLRRAYPIVEHLIGNHTLLPVTKDEVPRVDPRTGVTIIDQGRLVPSDLDPMVAALEARRALFIASFADYYFAVPKRTGYAPLLLRHKVPEARLIPIATVFPESVYRDKRNLPITKPEIVVGEEYIPPALTWSSEFQAGSLPEGIITPVDLFERMLQPRGEINDATWAAMRHEFTHIKAQLQDQATEFAERMKALFPPGRLQE